MRERRQTSPIHAFLRLRWMCLSDFIDTADEEQAALFTDLLALDGAYICQPLDADEYDDVRESATALGMRHAMFLNAGMTYTAHGFQPATRMVVFGKAVEMLRMAGLPLAQASWPHNAMATEPLLPLPAFVPEEALA